MKNNRYNETICINRFDTVRIIPHKERLFLFLEKYDTEFIYLIRLENNDEFFSCILNKPVFVKDRVQTLFINDTPRLVRFQRISCYYEQQRYVEDNLYNCLTHIEGVFTYVAKINKNTLQKDAPGTYLSTHNCSVIYQNNIGQILVHDVCLSLMFEPFSRSKYYSKGYDSLFDNDMFEVKLKPEYLSNYNNPIRLTYYDNPIIVQPNF